MLRATSGITRAQAAALSKVPAASQEWMGPRVHAFATATVAANTLYVTPYIAEETCLLDQIAAFCVTGVAGNAKGGIYGSVGNLPGALLGEGTADLSTAASGTLLVSTFASPVSVQAGQLLWLGWVFSAAPGIRGFFNGVPGVGGYFWPVGSLRTNASSLLQGGFFFVSRALTYVSGPTPFFPATFGAPTLTDGVAVAPAVRKA